MIKKILILLGVLCIVFCSADNIKTYEADVPPAPKKLALLVGIDDYLKVSDLKGCVNDVLDVKDLLTANFNFKEKDIRILTNYVFSDKTSIPAPYALASAAGEGVVVEAGLVHGATKGSKYRLYNPGTKYFDDPGKALADIELTKVEAFSSKAKIIKFIEGKKTADILQGSRAVEYEHVYNIKKYSIYFLQPGDAKDYFPDKSVTLKKPEDSHTLKKIEQEITNTSHYTVVKKGNEAQLLLTEVQGEIKIYRNSGSEIINSAVNINNQDAVNHVMKQLEHWCKWYNIRSIENHKSKKLRVELEVKGVTRDGTREGTETDRMPFQQFKHEDEIKFIVRNTGKKEFFFVILDISGDGSIAVVYPENGDGEALQPGNEVAITDQETFVADHYEEVTDIIKVIAADTQLNFKFLEMDAASAKDLVMKGTENPLTRLLKEAALQWPTKGVKSKTLDEWVATECVFKVSRKEE
jgi:hypothetical protein